MIRQTNWPIIIKNKVLNKQHIFCAFLALNAYHGGEDLCRAAAWLILSGSRDSHKDPPLELQLLFGAPKSHFFMLPRRLVIQDLSNEIIVVCFSLCGALENRI